MGSILCRRSGGVEEGRADGSAGGLVGRDRLSFVGHGLGIEIDEQPVLAPRQAGEIVEHMTIACEPKFFFPERGAVGVEDTYLVNKRWITTIETAIRRLEDCVPRFMASALLFEVTPDDRGALLQVLEQVDSALRSTRMLDRLTESLLMLARSESGELPQESVNLCDIARRLSGDNGTRHGDARQ